CKTSCVVCWRRGSSVTPRPSAAGLGQFLRVVGWNIERGLEYDAIKSAFIDAAGFQGEMA
ncbi:MAG TPA: hypothetical protein VHH35_16730, partial [Pyrinomonadaceae bacterium]|nr:hypothetical protein [Pyrinomonadaceae bacterium]